jgi:hypothetical protein
MTPPVIELPNLDITLACTGETEKVLALNSD